MLCHLALIDASNYAGNMWPLHDDQLRLITGNLQQLIQFLDSDDDFMCSLMATDCFTRRQMSVIKCIPNVEGRNEKILQLLKRRGVEHFSQFLRCLEQNQRHLIPLLNGNTGMVYQLKVVRFDIGHVSCSPSLYYDLSGLHCFR